MTLKHLNIFFEVCRQQSVTRAAEKLYMSQPAVSLAIRELEDHYGQKLFERIARRMYLTEAGKQLLQYAQDILRTAEEMEQKMQNQDYRKILRVGASMTMGVYYLPEAVRRFMTEFPGTEANVQVVSSDLVEEKILKNELDLGFIEGTVHSDMIRKEELGEDELYLICQAGNPLADKKDLCLEELKEEKFLLREKNSGTREVIDSVFLLHNFSVEPLWESASTLALVQACAAGLGLTIVPSQFAEREENRGKIRRLTLADASFTRKYHAIYHKNKQPGKEARSLIATVSQVTGSALQFP